MKRERRRIERAIFINKPSERTNELLESVHFSDFLIDIHFVDSYMQLLNLSFEIENSLLFLDMNVNSINILINTRNMHRSVRAPIIGFAEHETEAFKRIAEELDFYRLFVRTDDLRRDARELADVITINYRYSLKDDYPYRKGYRVSKNYWHDPIIDIPDFDKAISELLVKLGISEQMAGHKYLVAAVSIQRLTYQPPEPKYIYRLVADRYHTTPAGVEKAIRYAIESAWTKGNIYEQNRMFGLSVDESKGKPTNAEFIARVALEFLYK